MNKFLLRQLEAEILQDQLLSLFLWVLKAFFETFFFSVTSFIFREGRQYAF